MILLRKKIYKLKMFISENTKTSSSFIRKEVIANLLNDEREHLKTLKFKQGRYSKDLKFVDS